MQLKNPSLSYAHTHMQMNKQLFTIKLGRIQRLINRNKHLAILYSTTRANMW